MGNASSGGVNGRRDRRNHQHPAAAPQTGQLPSPRQPQQVLANHYVFAAATPFPPQYSNPNGPGGFYPYPQATGYYPPPPVMPMPMPMTGPYAHHHRVPHLGSDGRYSYGPVVAQPQPPFVEHQKAVTIRNDVKLRKETLRIEPHEENPGKFVVAFTFNATVAASITVIFFAKESEECKLTPTKESVLPPVTVQFPQGLGQKFRQPSGTGIDFSMFEESELLGVGDMDIYPLVVKAEVIPSDDETESDGTLVNGSTNSQIMLAVFDKEKGEYHVKVVKQILWVSGMRYELQEIYGIGNSVEGDTDGNDPGKECVICLSEPRDTTVLPCRHMCMCSGCAKVLRFQTNRCPICRQPVERLLEIKVSNESEDRTQAEV